MKTFFFRIFIFSISLSMLFSSYTFFSSSNIMEQEIDNDLFGSWVYSHYENNMIHYLKKDDFTDDKPGVAFFEDGNLLKRQNFGWCGTPPISYANRKGSWIQEDSMITMVYFNWEGKKKEKWYLVDLNEKELVLRRMP